VREIGTATWLNRAGPGNDLTTLSDRDLRDLGMVQVILVSLSAAPMQDVRRARRKLRVPQQTPVGDNVP